MCSDPSIISRLSIAIIPKALIRHSFELLCITRKGMNYSCICKVSPEYPQTKSRPILHRYARGGATLCCGLSAHCWPMALLCVPYMYL